MSFVMQISGYNNENGRREHDKIVAFIDMRTIIATTAMKLQRESTAAAQQTTAIYEEDKIIIITGNRREPQPQFGSLGKMTRICMTLLMIQA